MFPLIRISYPVKYFEERQNTKMAIPKITHRKTCNLIAVVRKCPVNESGYFLLLTMFVYLRVCLTSMNSVISINIPQNVWEMKTIFWIFTLPFNITTDFLFLKTNFITVDVHCCNDGKRKLILMSFLTMINILCLAGLMR